MLADLFHVIEEIKAPQLPVISVPAMPMFISRAQVRSAVSKETNHISQDGRCSAIAPVEQPQAQGKLEN